MSYLADTNILLRWIQPIHPLNPLICGALTVLQQSGEMIYVSPQNIVECWNVATRPAERNGLGMSLARTNADIKLVEQFFPLAPGSPAIYPEWRRLVVAHGVSGTQVHDARLAAAMLVHGITHILTLNIQDFLRFPHVTPVHPQDVVGTAPPT